MRASEHSPMTPARSDIDTRLMNLGIVLQEHKAPVAQYLGTKKSGNLLFVSGRVSELRGEVGSDLTEEQGKTAARDTIVLLLAIVRHDIKDLNRISGIIKLEGFIRSAPDFVRQPQVLDGASELLIEVFGQKGAHARTATGVAQLPFGAAVQLDMILELGAV